MRALIVDDAITVRLMLSSILKKLGYDTIFLAEHGKQALENQPQYQDLDLMVIDWNMPFLNGLELIKELRLFAQYTETPILMATTETERDKMIEALNAGANEYIMKPFTIEMLRDKLEIAGCQVLR